jgi:hypothetical protein
VTISIGQLAYNNDLYTIEDGYFSNHAVRSNAFVGPALEILVDSGNEVISTQLTQPSIVHWELLPSVPQQADVPLVAAIEAWISVSNAFKSAISDNASVDAEKPSLHVGNVKYALEELAFATFSVSAFFKQMLPMSEMQLRLLESQIEFYKMRAGASISDLGKIRENESKAQKLLLEREEKSRREEQELQNTAKKGQIFSLITSWIAGTAQVVTGIAKLAVGLPQGALEVAAGATSITNAILKTIVYAHPELQDRLREHIDRLDKAELALAVIGGVVGMIDMKRIIGAAGKIGSGMKDVLGGAGTEVANKGFARTLIRSFSDSSTVKDGEALCRGFGKVVADHVKGPVQEVFSGKIFGISYDRAFRNFFSKFLDADAVEKLVSDKMIKIGREMAEELAKKVGPKNISRLSREAMENMSDKVALEVLEREMRWLTSALGASVAISAFKAYSSLTVIMSVATYAMKTSGEFSGWKISEQKNEIQERLDKLLLEIMFLEFMAAIFKLLAEHCKERMEIQGEEYGKDIEYAKTNMTSIGNLMENLAGRFA